MHCFDEVANGGCQSNEGTLGELEDLANDIRESLYEICEQALSIGNILLDRLSYPLTGFAESVDARGTISDLEEILDEIRIKQQGIEGLVQMFLRKEDPCAYTPLFQASREDEGLGEKPVVSESAAVVEVEVFEEEMPVEFASERLETTVEKEEKFIKKVNIL